MKIAFIARGLSEMWWWVRQYIYSVVKELNHISDGNEYYIIYNDKKFLWLCPNHNEIVISGWNKLFWDWVKLPLKLRKLWIERSIFPKNIIPWFIKAESYNIIHDLAYFDKELNEYKFWDTLYMKFFMKKSCKKATKIITISKHSKKDIENILWINGKKIHVIYEAAPKRFKIIKNKKNLDKIKEKYQLPSKFFFYYGSLSPRKNVARLIQAYNKIASNVEHNLIISTIKSWHDKEVYDEIDKSPFKDRIKIINVSNEDMPYVLNLAFVLLYVSLYEGFGLPILEAQACACPVVTSTATSCPEVARDNAYMVNPKSIDEIAKAMLDLAENESLRKVYIEKWLRNIEDFTWKKTTEEIFKL